MVISADVKERSEVVVNNTRTAFDALKATQAGTKKHLRKHSKRVVRKLRKHHHYAIQATIVAMLAVFIFTSSVKQDDQTTNFGAGFGGLVANTTTDEVSTAQVAKQIAQGANLIIADNVTNLADSLEASVEFAGASDSYLAKPHIVSTDAKTNQDILEYTAKDGDTITVLARKFGVTSDSIRWANNITGDLLGAGVILKIPPVSGVIYEVQSGDTPETLAQRFNSTKEQIVSFNDAELSGLKVGATIIIPGGREPQVIEEPVYFSSGSSFSFGNVLPVYGGNGYSYGYCTWHAAERRAQIGRPIPRNLGNAVTWASIAAAAGLTVAEKPIAGAVLWHKNTYIAGGYGHVGFVEGVNADGSILVSDMNYPIWNSVTTRTIPPEEFTGYLFIY